LDLSQRRELNNGAGDALTRAFELTITPLVVAALGWWLDSRFGTFPLLALVLFAFAFAYECWKHLRRYSADLDRETDKMLGRAPRTPKGGEAR
jgi:F0F1-type ATP synthase assembly protein I